MPLSIRPYRSMTASRAKRASMSLEEATVSNMWAMARAGYSPHAVSCSPPIVRSDHA